MKQLPKNCQAGIEKRRELGPFNYCPRPDPDGVETDQVERLQIANGNEYEGELDKFGRKHGRGVMMTSSGSFYEGYWKSDKRHGRGRHIYFDGDVYIGEWVNDHMHGWGTYISADGTYFEGKFENGKRMSIFENNEDDPLINNNGFKIDTIEHEYLIPFNAI